MDVRRGKLAHPLSLVGTDVDPLLVGPQQEVGEGVGGKEALVWGFPEG
jgi:hypothetical protein